MFLSAGEVTRGRCEEDSPWSDRLILHDCALFARKFPHGSVKAVHDLLTDCKQQLDILAMSECEDQRRVLLGDTGEPDLALPGESGLSAGAIANWHMFENLITDAILSMLN